MKLSTLLLSLRNFSRRREDQEDSVLDWYKLAQALSHKDLIGLTLEIQTRSTEA